MGAHVTAHGVPRCRFDSAVHPPTLARGNRALLTEKTTMQFKSEREACEAWVASFQKISTSLLARAYPARPDGDKAFRLLAGGELLSNCCDETADTTYDDDDEPDGYACSACEKSCAVHWGGAVHAWPAAWGECFHPTEPLDDAWMRAHAEQIARVCGLLVYDSDDVGIVLAIDAAGLDFIARVWLPLYRLRGLEWHAPVEEDPPPRTTRRNRTKR